MNEPDRPLPSSSLEDEVILAESADSVPRPTTATGRTPMRKRKVLVPALLFLATCASTFLAGISQWLPDELITQATRGNGMPLRMAVISDGVEGLLYMFAVIGILLTHEMGHFLMTVRYRIPSTLPFFIPMPIALFGTMGAVIAMDGRRADRKEIFDIGIAGPLAGLVIAVPVLIFGAMQADFTLPETGGLKFDIPLFIDWVLNWVRPEGYTGQEAIYLNQMNPLLMAGWFGLLITGLNMAPVGQLDGGHVVYTLFGPPGRWIARGFVLAAIAFITITGIYMWAVMLMLVVFVLGVDHPPTANDKVPLGPARVILGLLSLSIPFLCLPLRGIEMVTN